MVRSRRRTLLSEPYFPAFFQSYTITGSVPARGGSSVNFCLKKNGGISQDWSAFQDALASGALRGDDGHKSLKAVRELPGCFPPGLRLRSLRIRCQSAAQHCGKIRQILEGSVLGCIEADFGKQTFEPPGYFRRKPRLCRARLAGFEGGGGPRVGGLHAGPQGRR